MKARDVGLGELPGTRMGCMSSPALLLASVSPFLQQGRAGARTRAYEMCWKVVSKGWVLPAG